MAGNSSRRKRRGRRVYTDELKGEAVQMLLDGHRKWGTVTNGTVAKSGDTLLVIDALGGFW